LSGATISFFHAKINNKTIGDGMISQSIRLVFPPSLQDEPIINRLMKRYSFTVNILRANVTDEQGWIDIHISGKGPEIEEGISWLREQGVEVVLLTN
jgi:ABC-type methionine transport system ATPase subunit